MATIVVIGCIIVAPIYGIYYAINKNDILTEERGNTNLQLFVGGNTENLSHDAWNNAFVYNKIKQGDYVIYSVTSKGSDGVLNTGDDIYVSLTRKDTISAKLGNKVKTVTSDFFEGLFGK